MPDFLYPEKESHNRLFSCYGEEEAVMEEKLQALIKQKILAWQQGDIYAISLYVYDEEDDPRRPVAVLGYNTRQQAEQSALLASNEQEARWNYAFWLQNEELCWGKGETAEAVKQWIAAQGLESREEEIAEAFRDMLTEVVREIHASGLLKRKFGCELPILIHGLEYDRETARRNREANGEALSGDFLTFCGLEQEERIGKNGKGQTEKQAAEEPEEDSEEVPATVPRYGFSRKSDIPTKFDCGEKKADMRHVIAFILMIILVMSTLGIYRILNIFPGAVADMEENGQAEQQKTVGVHESESAEVESPDVPGMVEAEDGEVSGEESAMQWQIYIHPDVPQPLAEVLEQYELAMNMGIDGEDTSRGTVEDKLKIAGVAGPCYIDCEMYGSWCAAMEKGRDRTICYSLQDLTGDGIPELIMGNGDSESVCLRVIYEYTAEGDIRVMDSSSYYDMTLYEGGVLEYVSGGVAYTITYWQYSQEEKDWGIVEALGEEWDFDNARDVGPYRQIITGGEYAEKEMISEEELERIRGQYMQKEMELQWYFLTSPNWHIPVASNALYDVYLEGISTDLWLAEKDVRQLWFSVYDKEGDLVQELVETSPYLPYRPDVYEGNFYFEDMNFDQKPDLMLLWVNINHPKWKAYLWREEEGVFREEPEADFWDEEGVFGYYDIAEEQEYIDETVPTGSGYTVYRRRYNRERGYYCVGALFVYYGDGTQDEEEERFQEYFYEDGVYQGSTHDISREEVSEIWSDLWE